MILGDVRNNLCEYLNRAVTFVEGKGSDGFMCICGGKAAPPDSTQLSERDAEIIKRMLEILWVERGYIVTGKR